MILGVKLEGWLTIAAIILGPMLAFGIQHWRDRLRDDSNRKRKVFHQLILTLKVPLAPAHVDAINSVPLEFYSHPETIRAWRLYTSHLADAQMVKTDLPRWNDKKLELLIDLVFDMGKALGYDRIDKATLRDNLYVPRGYEDQEEQFRQIRTTMLQVMRGEHAIPVTMVGPVQVEPSMQAVEEIATLHQTTLPARNQN